MRLFSKRHEPATWPSTRNAFTELGVFTLKTRAPVFLGKDLRAPGMDEERCVPHGQEAGRREACPRPAAAGGAGRRLLALLVLEAAQLEPLPAAAWSWTRRGSPSRRSPWVEPGRTPGDSGGRGARSPRPRSRPPGRPTPRRARTDPHAGAPRCLTAARGRGRRTHPRAPPLADHLLQLRAAQRPATERAAHLPVVRRDLSRRLTPVRLATTTSAALGGSRR